MSILYPVLLGLVACGGGSYSQKQPFDEDSGTTDSTGTTETDSWPTETDPTDSEDSTETADSKETDTEETDTDDTTTLSDICSTSNPWNPIETSPYRRDYDVEANISAMLGLDELMGGSGAPTAGSAYNEDYGVGWTTSGDQAWAMIDQLDAGGTGWDGEVYYRCDIDGDAGQFMVEFDATFVTPLMSDYPWAAVEPPRKVLPAEADMGSVGSWSYSDVAYATLSMGNLTIETNGTFTEQGFATVTLPDGSEADGYTLVNEYTLSVDTGFGPTVTNGTQTLVYAKGIGLVSEENVRDDGAVLVTKTLTGYSGLTPM